MAKREKEIRKQIKKEYRQDLWCSFKYSVLPVIVTYLFCLILGTGMTVPIMLHTSNFSENSNIHLSDAGVIVTGIFSAVSLLILLVAVIFIIIALFYSLILKIKEHKKNFELTVKERMNKQDE